MTRRARSRRIPVGFHAIGDRAAQMALDAFAEAERDAREKELRGRPVPQQTFGFESSMLR